MDSNFLMVLNTTIMFAISCFFDLIFLCIIIFLFYKLYKTKNIVTQNTSEIHNIDTTLFKIEQSVDEIQKG